jgi:hypothetical protein
MFPHIIGVERMTYTSTGSWTTGCRVSLGKKFASSFILWTRSQQIFEKPSSHLKALGTRRVTWSKLHYPCALKKDKEIFSCIIRVWSMTYTSRGSQTAGCCVSLGKKIHIVIHSLNQESKIFRKPMSHLKMLGIRKVTWSKLHTEESPDLT